MTRWQLCTINDDDAVIKLLAKAMWGSPQVEFEIATPWENAETTWLSSFCEIGFVARSALLSE